MTIGESITVRVADALEAGGIPYCRGMAVDTGSFAGILSRSGLVIRNW